MKKYIFITLFCGIFSCLLFSSTKISAATCPKGDKENYELDQIPCKDENGNPTGQEKMDCVYYHFMCCKTSLKTTCDEPE